MVITTVSCLRRESPVYLESVAILETVVTQGPSTVEGIVLVKLHNQSPMALR